jgi:hypothetical protein
VFGHRQVVVTDHLDVGGHGNAELRQRAQGGHRDHVRSGDDAVGPLRLVGEELADVFYFLLRFSQLYRFDLSEALIQKMKKNELKYPLNTSMGSNRKYSEEGS